MSDFLFKAFGCAAIATFMSLILKKWGGDFSVLVKLACGVVLSGICFVAADPIITYMYELSELGEMTDYFEVLLRVLSVAAVTHIVAFFCRECGEANLAWYAEFAGKTEILLISLPIIQNIVDTVTGILEKY